MGSIFPDSRLRPMVKRSLLEQAVVTGLAKALEQDLHKPGDKATFVINEIERIGLQVVLQDVTFQQRRDDFRHDCDVAYEHYFNAHETWVEETVEYYKALLTNPS